MARLLLIDDSELVLDMLAMSLSAHDLFRADCATAALEIVSRETLDAVVTDLNLPDLDGKDPVTLLREAGVDGPIFLMSGITPDELASKSDALGASGSLSKDLGLPGMASKLGELLAANGL